MPETVSKKIRKGHDAILHNVAEIRDAIRSYTQARLKLPELSDHLMTHWGVQDREFYELLYQHYEGDRETTKMLDFLVHDLKEVKLQYLIFFEKYNEDYNSHFATSFSKDFTAFSNQIIARINVEQEYLLVYIEKF